MTFALSEQAVAAAFWQQLSGFQSQSILKKQQRKDFRRLSMRFYVTLQKYFPHSVKLHQTSIDFSPDNGFPPVIHFGNVEGGKWSLLPNCVEKWDEISRATVDQCWSTRVVLDNVMA